MPFERLIGIVPLGVGLSVIAFAWSSPLGGFGAMPVFFRLFITFIALGFVLTGAALLSGQMTDPRRLRARLEQLRSALPPEMTQPNASGRPAGESSVGYSCPSCGAPLDDTADVSPHGDVRCTHCNRWFNVHQT